MAHIELQFEQVAGAAGHDHHLRRSEIVLCWQLGQAYM
jgi:hypothetical protein